MKLWTFPAAFSLMFMTALLPQASALVFWNLDNDANRTDPGGGLPWDTVGRVAGTDLSLVSSTGSAIHLGGGYMLTANHVVLTSSQRVTFDGTNSFEVDDTFTSNNGTVLGKQVATGVDLKVFKLKSTPSVGSVTLSSSEDLGSSATLVGYGVGRGATALGNSTVAWGNTSTLDTVAKRWGTNVPLAKISSTLYSVAGSGTGSPPGLGNSEAALTLIDSGSAMFQSISGSWMLIGVGSGVEQLGTTIFGNDRLTGTNGDFNYHVSISSYRTQILGIIPEPTSISLLLATAGCGLLILRRSRRN
ncbi:MAG: PEP-CTERM sorting domain-containing protein [Terrimicrobiaceae bacterium]